MTLTVTLDAPPLPLDPQTLADLDLPTLGHILERGYPKGLQRFSGSGRVIGRAVTISLTGTDSRLVHYATSIAAPGDFLIIDTGLNTTHAPIGGVMIEAFRLAGVVGIAIDGAATDVEELRASGVTVFARGLSPVTTRNSGAPLAGSINQPVSIGGVTAEPGHLVIADDNGLLITDAAAVLEIAPTVRAWQDEEPERIARLRAGERFIDLGVDPDVVKEIETAATATPVR